MRRWLIIVSLALTAALAPGASRAAGAETDPEADAARTRVVSEAIERDEERLKELLSTPRSPDRPALHDDPELREIARRLPLLQRELRHLRARAVAPTLLRLPASPPVTP